MEPPPLSDCSQSQPGASAIPCPTDAPDGSSPARDAAGKTDDVDYAQAGRALLAAFDQAPPGRFDPLNAIWRLPTTGALLYVGTAAAAQSRETLDRHGVRRIVFCQEEGEGSCAFEGQPGFEYLRFNIGRHRREPLATSYPCAYFAPLFKFVQRHLSAGENVLIHCLAGAHRAGTAGVACLMHFEGLDMGRATEMAKSRRPAISPIGAFPMLLRNLELDMAKQAKAGLRQPPADPVVAPQMGTADDALAADS